MTPHFQLLAFIVLGFALPAIAAGEPAILPNPASIQANPGHFALTAKTPIVIPPGDGEAPVIAANIAGILERERGLKLRVVTGEPRDGAIHLKRVMEIGRAHV